VQKVNCYPLLLSPNLSEIGNYCPFSHQTAERQVCKFFVSSEGCRRGNSCTFSHKKETKEVKRPKPVQLKPASAPPVQPAPVVAMARPSENPVNQLWGFESENENYFYGTAGAMDVQPYPRQYADALGYSYSESVQEEPKKSNEYSPVVCPFFLYGSCVYGSNCKNIHTLDGILEQNEFENILMNEEIEAARRADCGICLCPIENKSLGMLTNCWCTFCLECIRSWRKEGSSFTKTSHVRSAQLTPLHLLILCS
jgi:hypothetical protein